ncbi:MAG: type II secretion system F family protein [Candidatus Gracilibacteria bacterium]|nr:type II secretion system F family protein [Candidatus Gracilibacteria bacterium]MDD5178647.1 type II secretion system F family protein [Candidatus Gracilibacteria bacterium]
MLFQYTARDKNGKEVTGQIEAASKLEAADKLFNQESLNVVSLEKADGKEAVATPEPKVEDKSEKLHIGKSEEYVVKKKITTAKNFLEAINDYLISQTKITPQDKAVCFRLLAVMINVGLSIVKSLKILSEQTENKHLQNILREIANHVETGVNFSSALGEYKDIFNEAEVGMIASGEVSGQLNKTLTDLADETEKSANLKSKIQSALIYPGVVLSILVLAVILVMTLVIPNLSELFGSAGVELPGITRLLVNTSNWCISDTLFIPNWLLIILLFVGAFLFVKSWKATAKGRYTWDSLMLKLPLFGALNKRVALASFSRQLALLSSSGVAIIRSLEITANAVGNEVYKRRLLEVKEEVERGVPIHKVIEGDPLFPGLVVSMIAVGEQTAQLGNVAEKIAEFYDEEVNTFVKNLTTIMEPTIIVIVGVMVAVLVAAIMLPIMDIADIASAA